MTDLITELEKRLEFRKYECCDRDETIRMIGEQDENTRLKPLHAALIECVKAAKAWTINNEHDDHKEIEALYKALANLEKVIEEMK